MPPLSKPRNIINTSVSAQNAYGITCEEDFVLKQYLNVKQYLN